ncbi:MAG: NAD-dependent protein deacylase [Bacilli bacterium]|jgi:NAD-dependent deacetylase|nr:NAD-dependent protein deacylase [Bacilli bacterium]HHU23522.1 NAD-dependent protein deacylase [Acholeplasmataceae bacterium]
MLNQLAKILEGTNKILFFTGAGISVPSGIPDFRSSRGLYQQGTYRGYQPEEIISHSFFATHTEAFYKFYKEKMMFLTARPNEAHEFIAHLEAKGKSLGVITQNIDGLHQMAGSKNVVELHGSIHRNYCQKCDKAYDANYIKEASGVPKCSCGGIIKPDVVLYEEPLDTGMLERAVQLIYQADCLIVIGTSLVVNPAAALVSYFRGKYFLIINRSSTPYDYRANLVINEDIIKVVEALKMI